MHDHHHHSDHAHEHRADSCCAPSLNIAAAPEFRGGRAYKVHGLDCAEEVAVLRQAVGPIVGGSDRLAFDVLSGRMTVADDASGVAEEDIITAVARTGMNAVGWSGGDGRDRADSHRRQQILFTTASGILVFIGLVLHVILAGGLAKAWKLFGTHAGQPTPWPEILAYVAAAAVGARFVVVRAWYAARNLRPDMHLLMTVAVIGAMAIGEWFEAATVSFLFALSLTLESWSAEQLPRCSIWPPDCTHPSGRWTGGDRRGGGGQTRQPICHPGGRTYPS